MVSAAMPRLSILRSISRAERPASTRTRVRPDSTTHALPPDPEARTMTRTKEIYQMGETNDVRPSRPAGRPEASVLPRRRCKRLRARQFGADDRREDELCDALA